MNEIIKQTSDIQNVAGETRQVSLSLELAEQFYLAHRLISSASGQSRGNFWSVASNTRPSSSTTNPSRPATWRGALTTATRSTGTARPTNAISRAAE